MLHAVISEQDYKETYWPMVAAVRRLMQACEGSSDIRSGANPEDFLLLIKFLWQASPGPDGVAQTKRILAFLFLGLGADDGSDRDVVAS